MVKQETMDGTVPSLDKVLREATDEKPADALFLPVPTTEEFNECIRVIGKEFYYLYSYCEYNPLQ
jgi:hypothetical protein